MNKVDFSDINKFFTSLGLILIGLALLLPWYISKNINILLIDKENIENKTCIGKSVLNSQQEYLYKFNNWLPIIMAILIVGGIVLLIIGLIKWKKRQKVIYGIQDEEWRLKKMEGISIEEKTENIGNEIKDFSGTDKQTNIQQYIQVENSIYLKLTRKYSLNYIVEQNLKIDRYNFDIILKSKYFNKRTDLILEIKYFKRSPSSVEIFAITRLFLLSIAHYEQTLQRPKVIPILIFVLDSKEILDKSKESKQKMKDLANDHGIDNLRIIYLLKDKIESSTPENFIVE